MQGVVVTFDPSSGEGVIATDTDHLTYQIAPNGLENSIFRFLRQGQRVVFDLNDDHLAIDVRAGSEADMAGPTITV